MDIRERDLPGIGKKYYVKTNNGEKLVIIIHYNGRRELHHFSPDDLDTSLSMVSLTDEESRIVAGIIGGMAYQPKGLDSTHISIDGLMIDWYKIDNSAKCVGKQIGELDVRKNTGATIIAVIKEDNRKLVSPGADYIFKANTTLVVAGEKEQLKLLKNLLHKGTTSSS